MNSIIVRLAGEQDAALIATLSRQTFYDAFAPANTREDMEKFMSEQFTVEKLMQEVGAPGNIFLLAMDGEIPAGYMRLREENSEPALAGRKAMEIARIYAARDYIGKGVGTQLMNDAIKLAIEKGAELIWLGVWEHNEKAIAFYRRHGFEKFGDHPFILGNDRQTDWLMKKEL